MKNLEKYSHTETCPVRNVLSYIGSKWAMLLLLVLHDADVMRFGELQKILPDISTKVLTETLRTLETDGFITRTVYPEVPMRVEYSLTEMGHSLIPILQTLTDWAQEHMPSILLARKRRK